MDPISCMRKFNIEIEGVVHVGANLGQEAPHYHSARAEFVLFIEPLSDIFEQLQENIKPFPGQRARKALCSDRDNHSVQIHYGGADGQSSSIFPLGRHAELYPNVQFTHSETLQSEKLDTILRQECPDIKINLLVLDVQGAELNVLKGAEASLAGIDAIFLEVSDEPLYEGGCTLEQIEAFLKDHGFSIRTLEMEEEAWGDAFFVNKRIYEEISIPETGRNLALGKTVIYSSYEDWPERVGSPVDGVRSGVFSFHTSLEDRPWCIIDLETSTPLKEIRVYNRGNGSQERARNLVVSISDDGAFWTTIHRQSGIVFGTRVAKSKVLRIKAQGNIARFIRLQLEERSVLHLDEIEIY